jgi:hypothetical protein
MNATNDQHLSIFFNLSPRLRIKLALTGWNFARFQRAAKCSGQSAGRRGDHIIKGCGMGIVNLGIDSVVLGDLGMNTEQHRRRLLGQIRPAQRTFNTLYFYTGSIDNITHNSSFPEAILKI